MDIIKKLNLLGDKAMEKYPYLNNGGCCVYAAIVAKELLNHGIIAKGIVASNYQSMSSGKWRTTIDRARSNVRKNTVQEWDDNGVALCHVGLEFMYNGKIKHYDSYGVHGRRAKLGDRKIYKGRLELSDLEGLAKSARGWNDNFNRRNIPGLRALVKSTLAVDIN